MCSKIENIAYNIDEVHLTVKAAGESKVGQPE